MASSEETKEVSLPQNLSIKSYGQIPTVRKPNFRPEGGHRSKSEIQKEIPKSFIIIPSFINVLSIRWGKMFCILMFDVFLLY